MIQTLAHPSNVRHHISDTLVSLYPHRVLLLDSRNIVARTDGAAEALEDHLAVAAVAAVEVLVVAAVAVLVAVVGEY